MKSSPGAIALDATYSLGSNLSGVGVYSREIAAALTRAHTESKFLYCYRPHRYLRSFETPLPSNAIRRLLWNASPRSAALFHGLNQRLDRRYRRAIATFHDLFVLTAEYSTADFRERFTEQARLAAERADLIVAVSRFTGEQIVEHLRVEPSRIRVIPHGVRVPASSPPVHRQPMILFVGAIQKRKNIERLVAAFERTPPEWKLVLAGSLGYGAEEGVRAIDQSPRRADITLPGYIPDDELDRLYHRASIFAFPSLDEGFGIPVLEAMARGLPVLTSDGSALKELAEGAALLVNPLDTEAIAGGLNTLIADIELRGDLALRGLERSKSYTWERAAALTWDVYMELLS